MFDLIFKARRLILLSYQGMPERTAKDVRLLLEDSVSLDIYVYTGHLVRQLRV